MLMANGKSFYNQAAQLNSITTPIKLKAVIAIRALSEILVNVFMSEILWVNKILKNNICRPSLMNLDVGMPDAGCN